MAQLLRQMLSTLQELQGEPRVSNKDRGTPFIGAFALTGVELCGLSSSGSFGACMFHHPQSLLSKQYVFFRSTSKTAPLFDQIDSFFRYFQDNSGFYQAIAIFSIGNGEKTRASIFQSKKTCLDKQ